MPDDLISVTVAEAARRLGVSAQTVRRRISEGELAAEREPARRGAGWRWMILLQANAQAVESPPGASQGTAEPLLIVELRARVASLEEHLAQAERAGTETRQLLAGTLAKLDTIEERLRLATDKQAYGTTPTQRVEYVPNPSPELREQEDRGREFREEAQAAGIYTAPTAAPVPPPPPRRASPRPPLTVPPVIRAVLRALFR